VTTPAEGIHAHPYRKLGKRDPDPGRRSIPFGAHVATVPTHPVNCDDYAGIVMPMDGNDRYGDCVVAGWDHFQQIVTNLLAGKGVNLTWNEIVELYRTQNPDFDPDLSADDPRQEDNGMSIQLLLELLVRRDLILGFAKVDHTDVEEVRAAVYLGLAVVAGANLQVAQRSQTVWDYVPGSPTWGGHCFVIGAYGPEAFGNGTWGGIVESTVRFLTECCDEVWFLITKYHVANPAFRQGYDMASYIAAWESITGRSFPVPVVDPPTPVPPAPVVPVVDLSGDPSSLALARRIYGQRHDRLIPASLRAAGAAWLEAHPELPTR
jgi:hypothetical protein